jgi:hypothetical protein
MRTKKRKWLLIAASLGRCMHGIADLQTWTWRFISPANAARSASSQRMWRVTVSSSTRSTPEKFRAAREPENFRAKCGQLEWA